MDVLGFHRTPPVASPVVTAHNQTVAYNQQVSLSSIFSVSGSGITQCQSWFSWPEGGAPALSTVTNNGTPIAFDAWVMLSSLNGVVYTGSAKSGTDEVWLKAYNGSWSNSVEANISDQGNTVPAPVVTPNSVTVAYNQQVYLSNIFSVSGSGITQYQLWFSWPEGGAPALRTMTNGTSIPLDQ
jgi:hypothetical protein